MCYQVVADENLFNFKCSNIYTVMQYYADFESLYNLFFAQNLKANCNNLYHVVICGFDYGVTSPIKPKTCVPLFQAQ